MTALPKIDPCACGNDEPDVVYGESANGPAVCIRCEDCGATGWTDEDRHGAATYWNAGKLVMRADW
jgi:hypothetical protein